MGTVSNIFNNTQSLKLQTFIKPFSMYTRISFHYEYASAVMLIFQVLSNMVPLSIFKVNFIRVVSERKSERVEQLYILLTGVRIICRVFHNIM